MENNFNHCRPTQLQAAVCYIIAVVGVRLFGFSEVLLPLKYACLVLPLFLFRRRGPNMVHSMRNSLPSAKSAAVSAGIGIAAGLAAAYFLGGKTELTTAEWVGKFVTAGVLAAVCEELLFRGFLLPALERTGTGYAVVWSAVLFVTLHTAKSGLPEELIMGIVLALVTLYTNSVICSMLCHGAYNCTILAKAAVGTEKSLVFGLIFAGIALILTGITIKTGEIRRHAAERELIGRFEMCIFLCGMVLYIVTVLV